jgi:multisubunit Na+/H+ antiporter MnhB subunit
LKAVNWMILVGFAALLLRASVDLPARGAADAPTNRAVSAVGSPVAADHYIRNAYREAQTPNIVTVVLGDYRSLDTIGEQVVVFTAGLIAIYILRRRRDETVR